MLAVVVVAAWPAEAQTDACQAAEREMVYGTVALEDARDKKGFLESAQQFQAAVAKAPNCAQAHFNLGVVYEKAGEYQKAVGPLQTYLKLLPNAADAAQVRRKIIALEYRASRAARARAEQEQDAWRLLKSVAGRWYRTCANPAHSGGPFEFSVDGDLVKWRLFHPELGGWTAFSSGQKYDFDYKRFLFVSNEYISIRSSKLLESVGFFNCKYRRR